MKEYLYSELSEYFQVNETSQSGLVRTKSGSGKDVERYPVGTRAFKKNGNPSAWTVRYKGKSYYVHRIIWVLMHGSIDSNLVIDHLDGNPFNNTISNLCLKTTQDNSRNMRLQKQSRTGLTGVHLHKKTNGKLYYRACWNNIDGYCQFKYFSIEKFGDDMALDLAIDYREKQIQRLIEQGAGYTERHGK